MCRCGLVRFDFKKLPCQARNSSPSGAAFIVVARNSSPSGLKKAQFRRFWSCWASFFAEEPLEGLCWARFFAPTDIAPGLVGGVLPLCLQWWGGLHYTKASHSVSPASRVSVLAISPFAGGLRLGYMGSDTVHPRTCPGINLKFQAGQVMFRVWFLLPAMFRMQLCLTDLFRSLCGHPMALLVLRGVNVVLATSGYGLKIMSTFVLNTLTVTLKKNVSLKEKL